MEQVTDWKNWLKGLVAALVNGFASGIVLVVAEPSHFNLDDGFGLLVKTSTVLGLVGAANYLKKSPLPGTTFSVVLLALLLGFSSACVTAGGRHRIVVGVVTAHEVLSAVQDTALAMKCGAPSALPEPNCIGPEKNKVIHSKLAVAFQYDKEAALLVKSVPVGRPAPSAVVELMGKVTTLVNQIIADLPSGDSRTGALVTAVGGAR
jgi:hypothetical protein